MFKIFALVVFGLFLPVRLVAEAAPFGNLSASYNSVDTNGVQRSRLDDRGTRFGVRWAKYLNEEVEARYLIEASSALAVKDDLFGELRQAWFGVRGSFGEVRVGRHLSPTRVALDPIDLFADQAADQNTVLESEVLHDKSIAYINRFNGVGYAVVLSADDDERISQDMLANYNTEQVSLAVAYLRGSDERNTLRLGGAYRFADGHHLGAAFEHVEDTQGTSGHHAYLLNAGYQFGDTLFKIQAGRNEADSGGYAETLLGVGADYQLRPSTVLQAQYSVNDHRDHSVADRERIFSLGVSFQF